MTTAPNPNLMVSVIVCTHNPRRDYLHRTLDALKALSFDRRRWELLLVDNASEPPLAGEIDLSWHPHGRHIREEKLGTMHARLRGIREMRSDLLLFVDDDNVLDPDYLEKGLAIGEAWPSLGVWGGRVVGEFETPPPDWSTPYLGYLALREFDRDRWSNLPNQLHTTPVGAGMFARRAVADEFARQVAANDRRAVLGRVGKGLIAGEDTDLAFTACDLGLGTGQFRALHLKHLIPTRRLQEEYLLRLVHATAYANVMVEFFHGIRPEPERSPWRRRVKMLLMDPRSRRFAKALHQGAADALRDLPPESDTK